MLKNAKAILSTKVQPNDLSVIHGIRSLSSIWIVLVHEAFTQVFTVQVNTIEFGQVSVVLREMSSTCMSVDMDQKQYVG